MDCVNDIYWQTIPDLRVDAVLLLIHQPRFVGAMAIGDRRKLETEPQTDCLARFPCARLYPPHPPGEATGMMVSYPFGPRFPVAIAPTPPFSSGTRQKRPFH